MMKKRTIEIALRRLQKDVILIHWNVGFHKNPGMIKLQTRLVDHLKLLEQKIKDAKALPKVAKHD